MAPFYSADGPYRSFTTVFCIQYSRTDLTLKQLPGTHEGNLSDEQRLVGCSEFRSVISHSGHRTSVERSSTILVVPVSLIYMPHHPQFLQNLSHTCARFYTECTKCAQWFQLVTEQKETDSQPVVVRVRSHRRT